MEAGVLVQKVENHGADLVHLWKSVNEILSDLRRRLPQWVTWVLMAQTGALTAMLTYIIEHCLLGGK